MIENVSGAGRSIGVGPREHEANTQRFLLLPFSGGKADL